MIHKSSVSALPNILVSPLIDNTLSWDDHCQKILHSIRGKIAVLSKLQPIPPHITALLYKSYVLPVFDYCAAVWQPHNSRIEAAMERLHSKVSSLALHQDSLLSSSLRSRRRYHIAVQVYKAIHCLSPYFSNTFTLSSSLTGRPLRNPHSLHIPTVRTNYGKSSFYYRGATTWNSLHNDLYDCPNLNSFKLLYNKL